MGEQQVDPALDGEGVRRFVRGLLDDIQALEQMLEGSMIESGVRRIGAEQEMFLIDSDGGPAPLAMEMLDRLDDEAFTTELGLFNLEANLQPFGLQGRCLSRLEREILRLVGKAREVASELGGDVVLTGILPTIRQEDLGLDSMTPNPRYRQLNETMLALRGGSFRTLIKGLDELQITHDNILLEACNTSFQVHFQTGAREFAKLYNLAQAVTAPVLAAAANSPILLQHRLWHESRIALFQQSIDIRSTALQQRGKRTRVSFGERWVRESVIEIFREDVSRLRVVLAAGVEEDSAGMVARGEVPPLTALRLYNGTVYRWNRPCYGIKNGKAHLRIENRVLPSGPTPADEVANAAFYFGLMSSLISEYGPIDKVMSFDHAKANFLSAARHGLDAHVTWVGGAQHKVTELIAEHLLPLARQGLESKKCEAADIDRYLGIIAERVKRRQNGAFWALSSWEALKQQGARGDERQRTLVEAMQRHAAEGEPVHTWPLAARDTERPIWRDFLKVGQFMSTDLFTVRPRDLVDLAASMMDWEHIRHVPVEDDEGRLVGLVTQRHLLKLVGKSPKAPVAVEDIMVKDVMTCSPTTPTVEAIRQMRTAKVSCLPVVDEGRLVGLVTDADFLEAVRTVFEAELERAGEELVGS